MRGRKRPLPEDVDCIAKRTRAMCYVPPWPERQPRVLWQLVFDSGYVTPTDASKCIRVCRLWRKCVRHSPVLHSRVDQYNALGLVFSSGYVKHSAAYHCMQVCRQWHDCVHAARKLWQRIDFRYHRYNDGGTTVYNWSSRMPDAIAAKRPKELLFGSTSFFETTDGRRRASAVLKANPQLERVTFYDEAGVFEVRALDCIRAPLASLTLRSCRNVATDLDFVEIVASSPMLKQLKELRTSGTCLGDESAQLIAAKFTRLSVLHLAHTEELTVAGVRHLSANNSRTRTTLRELDLSGCKDITGDISEHILAMPNLEKLNVEDIPICTDKWAEALKRQYIGRHNRHIDVLNDCDSSDTDTNDDD